MLHMTGDREEINLSQGFKQLAWIVIIVNFHNNYIYLYLNSYNSSLDIQFGFYFTEVQIKNIQSSFRVWLCTNMNNWAQEFLSAMM